MAGCSLLLEECVAKMLQAILLGHLLRYLTTQVDETNTNGYLFASGVCLCSLYYVSSHHPTFFQLFHMNMQVRIAVSALVYRKSLRISQAAVGSTGVGKVVNLLSNDVTRFDNFFTYPHYIWISVIQLGLVLGILWGYFGISCLAGVACLSVFTPLLGCMGYCFGRQRQLVASKTDKRIMLMNEILNGIRVIKMYAWETPFSNKVAEARKEEMKMVEKTYAYRAVNLSLFYMQSKLIVFLALMTYSLLGNTLTPEKVFVAMALFQNVRQSMTVNLPLGISTLAETFVSIRRIEDFLSLEEYCPKQLPPGPAEPSVIFKNVSVKWDPSSKESIFVNVSFNVKPGDLFAVVGKVGSGKSSLLKVILQELPISSGEIDVNGSIAYTSQEPWIFGATVMDNILFGRPFDPWYHEVVSACALRHDFLLFPHGDKTIVGDKGVTLSGGQKARISLARAVYANADIYLLDDPLSAVDSDISHHLFEKCICGLLSNKIVFLVTHQLQFLPKVSSILLLQTGDVAVQGKYSELLAAGINLAHEIPPDDEIKDVSKSGGTSNASIHFSHNSGIASSLLIGRSGEPDVSRSNFEIPELDDDVGGNNVVSATTDSETAEASFFDTKGLNVYWEYVHSGSSTCNLVVLFLGCVLTQVILSGSDYWLQLWIKVEKRHPNSEAERDVITFLNEVFPDVGNRTQEIIFYSLLMAALIVITFIRTFGFFRMCYNASISLHRQLFNGVLRAPMRFFERNPMGRILNRFAKDIDTIDSLLPFTLFDTIEMTLNTVGVVLLVSIVSPIFLIPAAILLLLFTLLRRFYHRTSTSLKRLEGIARSPVFSHLSTSISGLATIRAFNATEQFSRDFDKHLDLHSSTWFLYLSASRWLGIVVDWTAVFYTVFVTFGVTALQIDAGMAGLAIASVISFTRQLQWGFRQWAETENHMVSVERVLEYIKIEPESPLESLPSTRPPNNWPTQGGIEFKLVSLRYGNDKPFLHDVSCIIQPHEKVGIVGFSGAGKTSFISALFRLTEPCQGSIYIDDVNILEIGLHELRSKISIIPQDPVLFVGTLRANLDPFEEFSDAEIWEVLQEAHLFETVKESFHGLDEMVTEGGSNLSMGQRQLVCLGRAVLRKNRILVMDEATANVDTATDTLIQTSVRTTFVDCTVLTIAHRLHTVVDCDRIIVMDSGTIVEFDEPYKLLQNNKGMFYHLVQETGTDTAAELAKLSKLKAELRRRMKGIPNGTDGDTNNIKK